MPGMAAERVRLRIGNLAKAVLVSGQAYQDPKEYVLYNNPRAGNDDFAEEMVRILVRVRRHLPKGR